MIKRIMLILIASLLVVSVAHAQRERAMEYELNTYEVGVKKEFDAEIMKVEYTNVPVSNKEVKIVGKVIIPAKYKVLQLTIDYYITDGNQTQSYIVMLDLTKGAIPNTFTFEKQYPLDLSKYEFELLVIEFVNEEVDTQSI